MERGGYRQVRVLSEGAGEEVSLCAGPDGESVVLRLVGETSADAAVSASSAESPHLAPLLDLFALPGDRFGLVYPWLPGGSLARLLARRTAVRPGEATTILVSVARALAALHAQGVAHGGLRPAGVLFDEAGTPVLARLTTCAPLTGDTRAADLRAYGILAAAVLSGAPGADQLLARILAASADLAAVEAALFEAAEPLPVDPASAAAPTIEQLLPSRSSPPATVPPPPPEGVPGGPRAAVLQRVRAAAIALRTVRPRMWIVAGMSAAALAAALLLVPGGSPSAAPAPSRTPEPSPIVADVSAVQAEDPIGAARALAAARDACVASGDPACLGGIYQAGSPLLDADRAGIGPAVPTLREPDAPATVQRTGDAALVTVSGARLLLVRVDGEWRLRDVFTAEQGSG